MYPILFKIGPLPIYSFGVMVVAGVVTYMLVTLHYARREGIKAETIFDFTIYLILMSAFGSRLVYVIGQWDHYQNNLIEIFMFPKGGFILMGGLLFGILTAIVYARIKRIPILKFVDVLAPGAILGYAVGRIGCFFNGCCFGKPTDLFWGIVFPRGSLAHSYFPDVAVHPTQLYAFFSMVLAFFVLVLLYRRKRFDGYVFFWALILYSTYRFLIEFIRFSPIYWLGLTPTQWGMIVVFMVGFFCLIKPRSAAS